MSEEKIDSISVSSATLWMMMVVLVIMMVLVAVVMVVVVVVVMVMINHHWVSTLTWEIAEYTSQLSFRAILTRLGVLPQDLHVVVPVWPVVFVNKPQHMSHFVSRYAKVLATRAQRQERAAIITAQLCEATEMNQISKFVRPRCLVRVFQARVPRPPNPNVPGILDTVFSFTMDKQSLKRA